MPSVLAHAFHGADLPVPLPVIATGALLALFGALAAIRRNAVPADLGAHAATMPAAGIGSGAAARTGQVVAAVVMLALLLIAIAGPSGGAPNLAALLVLVLLWGAVIVGSAVAGPWWTAVSPFLLFARLPRGSQQVAADLDADAGAGAWMGPVLLAGFLWVQRAAPVPGAPGAVAVLLVCYVAAVLVSARRWGPGWVRRREPLAALSTMIGALAPFGPDSEGRWRRRPILAGSAAVPPGSADVALLLLALGAILFRGLSYTPLWAAATGELTGWSRSGASTLGLIWTCALLGVVLIGSARLGARRAGRGPAALTGGSALVAVPLLVGVTLAIEGAVLVFSGRLALIVASDPLGVGWDLLGTAGDTVSLGVLSAPGAIYLEVGALLLAGVLALLVGDAISRARLGEGTAPAAASTATPGTAALPAAAALVATVAVALLLGG